MKSLRTRLTIWYGLSFAVVVAAFIFLLHLTLEQQLLEKACKKTYFFMPSWRLHDSLTEAEVHEIADDLLHQALILMIPVALVAVGGGYWLARQSLRPIANVNRQLEAKNPGNLSEPIRLPELDYEFRGLVRQLNELLTRLDASFSEMNNYAAKVAHELRTPLAILRLKVEQAGGRIDPELADELESELHRLSHVVEQSLLIARAEQGRVSAERQVFNLSAAVAEVVEDFKLLAAERNRRLMLKAPSECWVTADPRHVRQITHTLLTNALKHGKGNLQVRVRRSRHMSILVVGNESSEIKTAEPTLGLGLRVVTALLSIEPQLRFQRRHGKNYHVARLMLPLVEPPQSFAI